MVQFQPSSLGFESWRDISGVTNFSPKISAAFIKLSCLWNVMGVEKDSHVLLWKVTADCLVLWTVFYIIVLQKGTVNYRKVGFSYIRVIVFLTILGIDQMQCRVKTPLNFIEIANLIYLSDDIVGWVTED